MAAEQIRFVADAQLTLTACFVLPSTCERSHVPTSTDSRKMPELAPRLVEKGSQTVGSDATQRQQTIEAMREQHTIQAQHAAVRASGLCAVQAASYKGGRCLLR